MKKILEYGLLIAGMAAYFGFGGKEPNKTIREYENNTTSPSPSRLEELAKLYEVSVDAIRKYDFTTPIEKIYYQMWYEKQYLYYQLNYHYKELNIPSYLI